MTRILVTGGAGFLGQHLIPLLAEAGHDVDLLDLQPSSVPIVPIKKFCRRVAFGVDVTTPGSLSGHFRGIDCVFHLAGLVSFWRKDADRLYRVNYLGTRNVAREALRAGVPRLVHVSSVAAIGYDPHSNAPIDENHQFDWSRVSHKHYMMSKHLAEGEVRTAGGCGLDAVIVNPGLMWGPGDMLNSAKLILGLRHGLVPACPPGGTNIVDVRDVARCLCTLTCGGRPGERYILGGNNVSFREVYDVIADEIGVMSPSRVLPTWVRPVLYYAALLNECLRKAPPPLTSDNVDSSFMCRFFSGRKAERALGWRQDFSFRETIRNSIDWLVNTGTLHVDESIRDRRVRNAGGQPLSPVGSGRSASESLRA